RSGSANAAVLPVPVPELSTKDTRQLARTPARTLHPGRQQSGHDLLARSQRSRFRPPACLVEARVAATPKSLEPLVAHLTRDAVRPAELRDVSVRLLGLVDKAIFELTTRCSFQGIP